MTKKESNENRNITCSEENEIGIILFQKGGGAAPRIKKDKGELLGSGVTESETSNGALTRLECLPNMRNLEKEIKKYIIGQDEQVREIITAIYRAKKFSEIKSNVLIIGKSGTGKTETIKQIAKRLGIAYTIEDATKYTKEGYYGANVSDILFNLLENAYNDIDLAQKGIVVIDEIDKKVGFDSEDVAGLPVLKSMLKLVEGTTMKIPSPVLPQMEDFDTKDLIIIFLGAFSGLEKIRDKRLNKNVIGFKKGGKPEKVQAQQSKFTKQDLVEYGFPEEFVGRIDTIIQMNDLEKNTLARILKESELSIFKKYERELNRQGVSLTYDEKIFDIIADHALSLDTGARELSNVVNYIFSNIVYDVLGDPEKYTNCELSLEIVDDNTKYILS